MKKRILALALALLLTAGLSLNAFAGARDVASAYHAGHQLCDFTVLHLAG